MTNKKQLPIQVSEYFKSEYVSTQITPKDDDERIKFEHLYVTLYDELYKQFTDLKWKLDRLIQSRERFTAKDRAISPATLKSIDFNNTYYHGRVKEATYKYMNAYYEFTPIPETPDTPDTPDTDTAEEVQGNE